MNQMTSPPRLEIIPANAPFSDGQRSWLNGFLVGMLSLDGSAPLAPDQSGTVPAPAGDDGEAPWHDQTIAIADRMKLAEGTPVAPAHDGGNGAAGLRPVRLQLQRLFGRDREQERRLALISASPAARKPRGC